MTFMTSYILYLSLYSHLFPSDCSVPPDKEAIFLPLGSDLYHLHCLAQ